MGNVQFSEMLMRNLFMRQGFWDDTDCLAAEL
jgi:hypothetical protein